MFIELFSQIIKLFSINDYKLYKSRTCGLKKEKECNDKTKSRDSYKRCLSIPLHSFLSESYRFITNKPIYLIIYSSNRCRNHNQGNVHLIRPVQSSINLREHFFHIAKI
jgi:hypothetical protein